MYFTIFLPISSILDFDESGKVIAKYFSHVTKRYIFLKTLPTVFVQKNDTHSLKNTESAEWAGNVVSRSRANDLIVDYETSAGEDF